ncbi:MAG: hypothetical protein EBU97_06230, partial [Rhodobacteraceae bacterium]|nr:hypothetical protein [Paracoccaceae bacterium]
MTFSRFGGALSLRVGLHASVSVASLVLGGAALGNPLTPTVVTGDVSVSGLGSGSVVVTNNSNRAIVDWQAFSVGQGE